jgi:hypothetical protein
LALLQAAGSCTPTQLFACQHAPAPWWLSQTCTSLLAPPPINRASSCATELVAPAAIKLAEQLMTMPLKAPLHLIIACQPQGSMPPTAAAATCACHLGLQLLLQVFDHHSEARGELLRLCSVSVSGTGTM